MCSESGGADTLSRIERGTYAFPEEPKISAEAQDFVGRVSQRHARLVEPAFTAILNYQVG